MADDITDIRERTITALVDEQIAKRMKGGEVFGKPDSIRRLVRNDVCEQARAYPGWLRQQAIRLGLLKVKGPSIPTARCAYCNAGIHGDVRHTAHGLDYCSREHAEAKTMTLREWLAHADEDTRMTWARLAGSEVAAAAGLNDRAA